MMPPFVHLSIFRAFSAADTDVGLSKSLCQLTVLAPEINKIHQPAGCCAAAKMGHEYSESYVVNSLFSN